MKESSYSFSACFASVVIERFFDLSIVLVSFALMLQYLSGMPEWVYTGAQGLTGVAFCLLVFILLGIFLPDRLMLLVDLFIKPLPCKLSAPLRSFIEDFLRGASVLKDRSNLICVIVLSALIWLITFTQYYWMIFLFDIDGSFLFGVSIAVILALGVAAPSAPGFIGVFQVAIVAAFILFGYDKEIGTSYALLAHIHQYLIVIFFGIWVLIKHGLKFSDLRVSAEGSG